MRNLLAWREENSFTASKEPLVCPLLNQHLKYLAVFLGRNVPYYKRFAVLSNIFSK